MVVLFKDDDPKYLNVTDIYVSNDSIHISGMEYGELIRKELSEDDELSYTIKAKDYEKLLNGIKKEYPDYKPDENDCKKLWGDEWNNFNQLTRDLCMAIKAVFTVGIAYRRIYSFCGDIGINVRGAVHNEVERWEWTIGPTSDHEPTLEEAENLVKERIKGFRKGTKDVPAYLHSFRVRDLLKKYGFDETVQLAGLLHDIVEDGNTAFGELNALRYPIEVVKLIDLATHDQTIEDHFERRELMMERLEEAGDKNAWAIKLADICDNVNECHLMPNLEKKKKFLYVKCPYFVKQGNKRFGGTEFYQEFLDRYLKQLFRLLEWENDNKFLPNFDDNEMIYWVDDGIYYKFPNKITEKNKHEAESFDIKYAKFSDFSGKTADEIAEYCFNTNYNFGHDISESEYNSRREDLIGRLKKNS